MRIALLTDIHGNLAALAAVVADLARRAVDRVVTLGDQVSGPLLPRETADFLIAQPWQHIAGNHERQLLACDTRTAGQSDRYALEHLTPAQLDWLRGLPSRLALDGDVLLCHGTPVSPCDYLLDTVEHGRLRLASAAEIESRLAGVNAAVVACGHSHLPRVARTGRGQLLVNPGSVGLPAYEDATSPHHVVETGSPDARYAVLEVTGGAWTAALFAVPYDFEAMAKLAESNGRPDWAYPLRTGYVLPAR